MRIREMHLPHTTPIWPDHKHIHFNEDDDDDDNNENQIAQEFTHYLVNVHTFSLWRL